MSQQAKSTKSSGADPISAIANAVGEGFKIFQVSQTRKLAYQDWLNAAVPQRRELWSIEPAQDNTPTILMIMAALVAVVVIAAVYNKK